MGLRWTRYDATTLTEADARRQPGSEVSWTASFYIKAWSYDFTRVGKDVGFVASLIFSIHYSIKKNTISQNGLHKKVINETKVEIYRDAVAQNGIENTHVYNSVMKNVESWFYHRSHLYLHKEQVHKHQSVSPECDPALRDPSGTSEKQNSTSNVTCNVTSGH